MTHPITTHIQTHQSYLKTYAHRLTQNQEEANDLFQDTCLNAWRFQDKYEEGTNVKAWLTKIMRNQFVNDYWKKKLEKGRVDLDTEWLGDNGPSQEVSMGDFSDEITTSLAALNPATRSVVLMVCVMGYSYEETAAITGTTLGTIRSKLFHGKKKLSASLKEKYAV